MYGKRRGQWVSGKSARSQLLARGMIASAGACLSAAAFAQQPPAEEVRNTGVEEIFVSARKLSESLISVPVAVTALSEQDIQRYNATDLTKIGQLAPQVVITRGQSGGGANLVIRGLGSGSGDQALEQTVSINIDGVQVGRGRILSMGFFDLQQVEVLKGPQALYFGKNSPAGVISLTSAGPTEELSGSVRTGYEFEADEAFVEAAISGAITDKFKARLAVRGRWMEGYLENNAQAVSNPIDPRYPGSGAPRSRNPKTEDLIGRLTLEYEPSDGTTATLRVLAGESKEGGFVSTAQPVCVAPATSFSVAGIVQAGVDCELDERTQQGGLLQNFPTDGWTGIRDGKPYQDTTTSLSSLTIDHDFGSLHLTSVTGYFDLDFKGSDNSGFSPLALIWATIGEHTKTFSQEVRLNSSFDGPLNFTVGGYYSHNDMEGYTDSLQFFFGPIVPDPATGRSYTFARRTEGDGEAYSGFTQLRWNPIEKLELAGGVRYTHETKSATTLNTYVNPRAAVAFRAAGLPLVGETKEDNWSPEFTATYHPTLDQTLYAAYKTGYKSGGISQPSVISPTFNNDNILFRPEKIKGYEAGYKAESFDSSVRFDLTLYTYDVSDLQVVALLPSSASLLTNAAKARSKGVEANVVWQAIDSLALRLGAGYNRSRYLSFPNSPCYSGQTAATGCTTVGTVRTQDLSDQPLPRAPEWNVLGGFSFEHPLGSLRFGLDADFNYTDDVFPQDNLNPTSLQKAYTLFNAGMRIGTENETWQLALIGRNLTNKFYRLVSVDAIAGAPNTFGMYTARPREITLQGTYRF